MVDATVIEELGVLGFCLRVGNDLHKLTIDDAERLSALLEVGLRQYWRTNGKRSKPAASLQAAEAQR